MKKSKERHKYKIVYPYLKWILSALSVYFFFIQFNSIETGFFDRITDVITENVFVFLLIILLALINWNGEAYKFSLLIKSEVVLSRIRSFLIILGGMAISNFTPARTGEYIGRGLLLKNVHPLKVVIATVAGNIAQVSMTYGLGLVSVVGLLFFTDFGGDFDITQQLFYVAAVLIILILIAFNIKRIVGFVKQRLPASISEKLDLVKQYNRKLYKKIVWVAFIRYLAFSTQFYLLMQMFSDASLELWHLLVIPSAYLLQSVVPVPAISDVGVRVAVTQLLFGSVLGEEIILQSVTLLWFLNFIVPGLLGTVYLIYTNFKQR